MPHMLNHKLAQRLWYKLSTKIVEVDDARIETYNINTLVSVMNGAVSYSKTTAVHELENHRSFRYLISHHHL